MTENSRNRPQFRTQAVATVVAVQAVAAAFFIGDVIADVRVEGLGRHVLVEAVAALALLAGVLFGALELRRLLTEAVRHREALAVASGALSVVVRQRFADWGLTAAESDVALFALKGFDSNEIARLRGAAPGTVRAQLAQVYAKAGVNSRAALVSLFFDELMDGLSA